jgi:hypothetical protein
MGRKSKPRTPLHDIEINMDYFLRHQQPGPNGCIEWNAGMHRQGYGMMSAWRLSDDRKIMTTTHRVAARIGFDRAIDSKEMVIHTCSNMKCCNPDHLQIGDRYDIHRVMNKNKRYRPRGKNIYPTT